MSRSQDRPFVTQLFGPFTKSKSTAAQSLRNIGLMLLRTDNEKFDLSPQSGSCSNVTRSCKNVLVEGWAYELKTRGDTSGRFLGSTSPGAFCPAKF